MMLRQVHLLGPLADELGRTIELNADTPSQVLSLLRANAPGVRRLEALAPLAAVAVRADGTPIEPTPDYTFEDAPDVYVIPSAELHGVEVAAALASWLTSAGMTAAVAAAVAWVVINVALPMAIGAAIQALGPKPQTSDPRSAKSASNFVFNGVYPSTDQGAAIPVVFGTFPVGAQIISQWKTTITETIIPSQELAQQNQPPAEEWQNPGGY